MSGGGGAGPLMPTFHGFVSNSMDGLMLFEACLSGKLHHVPRRPHDRERSTLIKSGSIFIYEENASGIKRWTDGVAWSPSRILGNFLIYRELEKPFPPGEKKRAMKRKRTSLPGEPYSRRDSEEDVQQDLPNPLTPPTPTTSAEAKPDGSGTDQDKDLERSLIGSLVDSYGFRPEGLVKKTMSISINGISHHMVSYYKVEDVKNGVLPRPMADPRMQNISVRPELYLKQNFRSPVEETEHYGMDGQTHALPQHVMYSTMPPGAYGARPGQYFGQQYPVYAMNTTSAPNMYGGMTGTAWPPQQAPPGMHAYGSQSGYASQSYSSYYKGGAAETVPPAVKHEDHQSSTQPSSYANQYSPSYPAMQRNSAQSTPSMMQSSYSAPILGTSTFGSMSAPGGRPPYTGNMHSPSSNGQSQQLYASAPAQSYAVRSPSQSYAMQTAPGMMHQQSQSPHLGTKNPLPAPHGNTSAVGLNNSDPSGQIHGSNMPYRSNTYPMSHMQQPVQSGGDMSGLGITGSQPFSANPQTGQAYGGYGAPGQGFRAVGEVGPAQGTHNYPQ